MRTGDVVLLRMPRFDTGATKLRPALILAELPGPYGDLLVCGITTQLHQEVPGWDDPMLTTDDDYASSGVRQASLIRLGHILAAPRGYVAGVIGRVEHHRVVRLRGRLADHLRQAT